MSDLNTYQTKVGKEEGGARFFVKEDGYMQFFDTDFTGASLRLQLLSMKTITEYISSISVLAASVVSPAYGYALFSLAAGCSKASIKLPSAEEGAVLVLNFSGLVSNAIVSIMAASAGGNASCTGLHGSDLSTIYVSHGAFVKLVCETAGLWSIVETNTNVTEQASS